MGGRRRMKRRGRSRGEAGVQSVCSQDESAAAGQWTVSSTDPNGNRAVSFTLESKVGLTEKKAAHRVSDDLSVYVVLPAFKSVVCLCKRRGCRKEATQRSRQSSSWACRPSASGY